MLRTHLRFALPAALAVLLTLPGCRPGTALHSRYNNFRAYYNTYYNASRKLHVGEEALRNADAIVDRSRLVELFPTGGSSGQNANFQEAIDKSAELLRNRPSSKWADDALLVIGKAYFYQRNFVGAEQKFRETIEAAAVADDRKLADEATFWLGRNIAAADRFDDGVAVLQTALAEDGGNRYWRARMTLALGELYARAARWDEAAETLREGIAAVRSRDLQARAYLLLGQVEEIAGRFENAADAYQRSASVSRTYELTYAANISNALVRGLDVGEAEEALRLVRSMSRDDKNYQRRGEVALVRGRLLAADQQDDAALSQLRDVLYDRDLAGQLVRGEAHLRLAEFYRDRRGDFILASAHLDTAATALPAAPPAAIRTSRTAMLGVRGLAQTFRSIAIASTRIAELDSLLVLGSLGREAFDERIAAIEEVRYEKWVVEQRAADAIRAQQDFSGGAPIATGAGVGGRPGASGTGAAGDVAGFLGYRDVSIVQAGLIAFERTWGDRPLGLNWRRRAALQTAIADGAGGEVRIQAAGRAIGGPPPLDLSDVPRTPEAQAEMGMQRAELEYELGNAFFLSLNRLDLAAELYRTIIDDTPDAPVANRARYALAEVEAAAGRPEVARPIYMALASSAPDGILGEASRARLEGREPDTTPEPAVDSAKVAFDDARAIWDAGDARRAATAFVATGERWADTDIAPRAFLSAAYAYVSLIGTDSLSLVRPLPKDLASETLSGGLTEASSTSAPSARPTRQPPGAVAVSADDKPTPQQRPGSAPAIGGPPPVQRAPPPVQGVPPSVSQGAPPPVSQEAPPPVSQGAPPPVSQGAPPPVQGAPPSVSQGAPPPVSQGAPPSVSQGAPPPIPQGVPPSAQASPLPASPDVQLPELAAPMMVDSTAAASDARPARAVAVAFQPDSTTVDSTAVRMTLRDYLRGLARRYPDTPAATRATALFNQLPAPPPPVVIAPDTTLGAFPTDSTAAGAAQDSTLAAGVESHGDDGRVDPLGAERRGNDGGAAPSSALKSTELIDASAGGFTWKAQAYENQSDANVIFGPLRAAGYRVAIAQVEGAIVLIMGQFESEEEAESYRLQLPAWAQFRASVVPMESLMILDAGAPPDDGKPDLGEGEGEAP